MKGQTQAVVCAKIPHTRSHMKGGQNTAEVAAIVCWPKKGKEAGVCLCEKKKKEKKKNKAGLIGSNVESC